MKTASPHYKPGRRNNIAVVFSCPGKKEEIANEPAAGMTGRNLEILFRQLNGLLNCPGKFTRENVTITNASTLVEYKKSTGRSESQNAEILNDKNLERLYDEIRETNELIICSGAKARLAIEKLTEQKPLKAVVVKIPHLGFQSLNRLKPDGIPEDIPESIPVETNTEKRIFNLAKKVMEVYQ